MKRFDETFRKSQSLKDAEASGMVADSTDVRRKLVERMENGEITLEELQAELKRIKREGKKRGLLTREQAFARG
jgi:cell fate (sporulation/competence/biofilm development) regulator YlbF (YheA/YmcA/DUF963 family)